jgi:DegV family protein with EDD domain
MALRNGLMIDASAELPEDVLRDARLAVLPVKIQIGDRYFLDARDAATTQAFTATYLDRNAAENARSVPYRDDEMRAYFLDKVATQFDHVFGLFVTRTRSTIYDSAFAAASRVIGESVPVRNAAGLKGPLFVECYDSQNLITGYGVLVLEMLRTLDYSGSQAGIRARLESIIPRAYTYLAPRDLEFILTRGRARGDQSVGLFSAAAARFLNVLPVLMGHRGDTAAVAKLRGYEQGRDYVLRLARRELQRGLLAPYIAVSFSGDTDEVRALPQFQALCDDARAKDVTVTLCAMSPTNAVNVGAGALAVGFIAEEHPPTL